jgi:tetraacyldisaccharide 4'-kinase
VLSPEMQSAIITQLRSNIFLKPVLILFSYGYALVVWIRNTLFDRRILRISRFTVPVISVGNIVAGGTGKTPFTMELIRLLNQKFKRIAVISRGYKRQSRGLQLVSDGKGFLAGVETGGDEPVLIARRFPDCVVLVAEKRSQAIEQAIQKYQAELIILDDAFQHRWVERDADIVLLAQSDLPGAERLLPAGQLREPLSSLKRANLVMLIHKESIQPVGAYADLRRYYQGYAGSAQIQVDCLVDATLTPLITAGDLRQLAGRPVIAFAGVANPDSFNNILLSAGVDLRRLMVYPDHHIYSEQDLADIKSAARKENCADLLTTEKDLVKLPADQFSGYKLLAVRIKLGLELPQHFQQKLDEFIDKTG